MATVGRGPGRGEHGFGLLEVILSLTVLLLVLIASSYLVDNVVQQAAFNRQRVSAAELAEQYLETTSNATLSSLQADISKDVLLTATPVRFLPNREYFHTRITETSPASTRSIASMMRRLKFRPVLSRSGTQSMIR